MGWEPQPLAPPHVCALTNSSEPSVGPFYESNLAFMSPFRGEDGEIRVKPQMQTLYLSAQAIREMCAEPGSPLIALERETMDDLHATLAVGNQRANDLEDRVQELQSEIEVLTRHLSPIPDPNDLIPLLDERYARKTGPKPKAAA